jgi:uncharacterized membrane protein YsdA (DUF1294 family)
MTRSASAPLEGDMVAVPRHRRSPVMMVLIPAALIWLAVSLAIWFLLDWRFLWAWLIGGTATTLIAYAIDKGMARAGGRRVPKIVLFGMSLYGGVVGAWIGMLGLRHKTRQRSFWAVQWVATALWVAVVAWVLA